MTARISRAAAALTRSPFRPRSTMAWKPAWRGSRLPRQHLGEVAVPAHGVLRGSLPISLRQHHCRALRSVGVVRRYLHGPTCHSNTCLFATLFRGVSPYLEWVAINCWRKRRHGGNRVLGFDCHRLQVNGQRRPAWPNSGVRDGRCTGKNNRRNSGRNS